MNRPRIPKIIDLKAIAKMKIPAIVNI